MATIVRWAVALLHDVVEDHGGEPRLAEVRDQFGDDVADMVAGLSDSVADTTSGAEKPPWPARKQAYLEHIESADDSTVLVSAAYKLHNLRAIVADYRSIGPELWTRFNQTNPAAHRWYYGALVELLAPRVPPALAFDLCRTLDDLDALLRERQPAALEPWSPESPRPHPTRTVSPATGVSGAPGRPPWPTPLTPAPSPTWPGWCLR